MTAALARRDFRLSLGVEGTGVGGKPWVAPGLAGTSAGVTIVEAAAKVPTLFRRMATGMLEAVEPGWFENAARIYDRFVDGPSGTGSYLVVRRLHDLPSLGRPGVMVPERMIAEIRATLGLNIAETARALGVERPTVYAWLAGQVQPQRANLIRLGRVADIAASWRRRTRQSMGDLVRLPGADGRSIADLLADRSLADGILQRRLDEVAASASSPGARVRRTGVRSIYEVASANGIGVRTRDGSTREIDWLTRRPLGSEDD